MTSIKEKAALVELKISNLTSTRLDEIYDSMNAKSKAELVNSIRAYVVTAHSPDEVQSKSERLTAAIMAIVYQYEECEVVE